MWIQKPKCQECRPLLLWLSWKENSLSLFFFFALQPNPHLDWSPDVSLPEVVPNWSSRGVFHCSFQSCELCRRSDVHPKPTVLHTEPSDKQRTSITKPAQTISRDQRIRFITERISVSWGNVCWADMLDAGTIDRGAFCSESMFVNCWTCCAPCLFVWLLFASSALMINLKPLLNNNLH